MMNSRCFGSKSLYFLWSRGCAEKIAPISILYGSFEMRSFLKPAGLSYER